jgi:hypothetical protein
VYGEASIPERWLERLALRDELRKLANEVIHSKKENTNIRFL